MLCSIQTGLKIATHVVASLIVAAEKRTYVACTTHRRSIGATVRLLVEDILAIAAAVAALAWFAKSSLLGQPEFEPVLTFLGALTVLMGKEPLRERLAVAGEAHLHDRALFEAFLRVLPTEPTIRLLKEHDFGDSFPKRAIDPLYEFTATWGSVENEFLNARLEKEKRALFSVAGDLAAEIAHRTVPLGIYVPRHLSVVSDQQRASGRPRPPSVREDARVLNAKAAAFVAKYEAFVRLCRSKLPH